MHTLIPLGTREVYSGNRVVTYSPFGIDLGQHGYVIGASGSGKTNVLRNLLIQAIDRGEGIGCLDPHGDLATDLIDYVARSHIRDVCYFDAADLSFPMSWNLLASVPADQQPLVTEGIVGAFRNLFGAGWGYRTEHILRNSVSALLVADNTSLLGVAKILTHPTYRASILNQVTDPGVRGFWFDEFEQWSISFRQEAIAPLQNKLGALFASPAVRNILGQVKNRFDPRALMDNRGIFIARLPKGLIGDGPANLLGALLLTQFQQAALQRANAVVQHRTPFHLVIDEFQCFVTDEPEAFATTLAEARKYGLFLTLAHQFTAQIHSDELQQAIFSNVGNTLAFRVSGRDARLLEDVFAPDFTRPHLVNLKRGEVIAKIQQDGAPGTPFRGTIAPPIQKRQGRGCTIIAESRKRFAQPRAGVEERITKFLATGSTQQEKAHHRGR